ncbi:MAG: PKD domain-containing protein [Mariniphaga sp.]
MKFLRLIIIFLISTTLNGFGQTDPCHKSTEGKDFWFGFIQNRFWTEHRIDITLTSVHKCKYSLFIGKSTTPSISGIVMPNTPLKVPLDWLLVEPTGSENIQERGLHLVSDSTLNLYAMNWGLNSCDIAVIFPKESLGNEYYALCYTPHPNGTKLDNGNGRNSEFAVVASEDNTHVIITPSRVTDQGKAMNTPFSITLNKGEIYQVQSQNLVVPKSPDEGDLTGSHIKSDKPVALYSGCLATTVPNGPNIRAWDHLYEQIPPLHSWGRKFITVPLKTRHEDTFRVLAAEDNTLVQVGNQTSSVSLNKGQYYEFMLKYNEPSMIDSNKPILLAQYSNSVSVDSLYTGGDGDPFMVIISPVNQTREKVSFLSYDSNQISDKNFVNVIVKNDALGKINLDGKPIAFTTIGTTGYSYVQANIGKGSHLLETTEPGKGFIAYAYAFGGYESYGYGVGFNLDIVLDLGGNLNVNGDKLISKCYDNLPLELNAGNSFDDYLWSTGGTSSLIEVSESGWYSVKVSTNEGCNLKDSVQLLVSKPSINLGADQTVCKPGTVALDAGKDFVRYSWSTSDSIPKIIASKTAVYSVKATNQFGCIAKDTISLSFIDNPKLDFAGLDTMICGSKDVLLDVKNDKGTLTFKRLFDGLVFNNPNISVPEFGHYKFNINAIDQYSCQTDTIVPINFEPIPTVDFSIDSLKCYGYNLVVKYLGNAKAKTSDFSWVFGNETIKHGIGIDSCSVPLGINRSSRDLKLTVSDKGCSNIKILRDIKVIPNLQMWTTDTLGCEPYTAQLTATNSESVDYVWDFGDGNFQSGFESGKVTNTYQNDGFYTVKLKVTTNQGCTNQISSDSLIHVAPIPSVGFSNLQSGCLEKSNQEIFYDGNGLIDDKYKWDLSALDSEEIAVNPLETKGPLILNLKNRPQASVGLQVISKFGCKSEKASISIKRKPDFAIGSKYNQGCAPFVTELTGVVFDPIDIVDFNWKFGDDSTGIGAPITHSYVEPNKKYTVTLTGKSRLTGCSQELINKNFITTYPNPTADFNILDKIIYADNPSASFINSSIGSTSYLWDFGDKTTSSLKDPSHVYSVKGYQDVLLTSYNEFMCSDTVSHKILIAFNRLFPPNGFSPNAPNIVDREFKLISEGVAPGGYHLRIVNRWNDIVFETGEVKGWNGQMISGLPAPSGVYIWILDFNDFLGRRHRQSGTVTLFY